MCSTDAVVLPVDGSTINFTATKRRAANEESSSKRRRALGMEAAAQRAGHGRVELGAIPLVPQAEEFVAGVRGATSHGSLNSADDHSASLDEEEADYMMCADCRTAGSRRSAPNMGIASTSVQQLLDAVNGMLWADSAVLPASVTSGCEPGYCADHSIAFSPARDTGVVAFARSIQSMLLDEGMSSP